MNPTGDKGEAYAARLLLQKGYLILAKNFRTRYGEIDLIAQQDEILAFVEVKTRTANGLSRPAAAVTAQKQRRLILAAEGYLISHPGDLQPRFDVVEVVTEPTEDFRVREATHIEGAFDLTRRNRR